MIELQEDEVDDHDTSTIDKVCFTFLIHLLNIFLTMQTIASKALQKTVVIIRTTI